MILFMNVDLLRSIHLLERFIFGNVSYHINFIFMSLQFFALLTGSYSYSLPLPISTISYMEIIFSSSPTKWDKFKPATPMESVSEEDQDGNDEIPIHYADTPDLSILSSAELHPTLPAVTQTVSDDAEVASSKKNRSLSISSQVSVGSASKLPPRPIKSNKGNSLFSFCCM